MNFTNEQLNTLKDFWKYPYYPSQNNLSTWLNFISEKGDEKDIKKINSTLSYFNDLGIDFSYEILSLYQSKINANFLLPNFSYCTIFNFIKTHKLLKDEYIPFDNILNGSFSKVSRFHRENQIKLLLLFPPSENLINKLLSFYTEIHKSYTIELPEQKKILKTFNSYALPFVKNLNNEKQTAILKQIDFICSGLNNDTVKDISINHEEEFSFKFTLSVNNTLANAENIFNKMQNILFLVISKMPKKNISDIIFKELNSQKKLGLLQFKYAFFSNSKECINQYSDYFKEFNQILTNDSLTKSLKTADYYVEIFDKICFKNKLLNKFEEKNLQVKKTKI